jgi:hypothetical protein
MTRATETRGGVTTEGAAASGESGAAGAAETAAGCDVGRSAAAAEAESGGDAAVAVAGLSELVAICANPKHGGSNTAAVTVRPRTLFNLLMLAP